MNDLITCNTIELDETAQMEINGGYGGGGSWGIAYTSHAVEDFFRGVYDGLSSMWK